MVLFMHEALRWRTVELYVQQVLVYMSHTSTASYQDWAKSLRQKASAKGV